MLRQPYDTPTFKTNALHLVSDEERLRRRILPFLTRTTHPLLKLNVLLAMKGG